MASEIRVPPLGESVVEATVGKWLKHEGDAVEAGDVLVELETDKVNIEVSAQQSGVLQRIARKEGDVVAIGEVLGTIGDEASAQAPARQQPAGGVRAPAEQQPAAQVPAGRQPTPVAPAPAEQFAQPAKAVEKRSRETEREEQPAASPLARRIAAEHNVDLAQVQASTPHGRVTKEDVLSYLEQKAAVQQPLQPPTEPPSAPPQPVGTPPSPQAEAERLERALSPVMPEAVPAGREERIRLSRRRQTIAQRLVEAQHTAAMLTTFNEIDMSAVMEIRSRYKEMFKERYDVSLGFMSFFTKAAVSALKAFPQLNAEIQGNELVLKYHYDIGIAVSTDEGLVVPVLRDADHKSFAEIEREIADMARRAREGKLTLAELQGGTFTITNGGVFGSLLSTPILNGPQAGILGMHKVEQRPVVVNNEIVIRPMMYVALSYDHRIADGREAVQFLVKVKELVEDPVALLLEG